MGDRAPKQTNWHLGTSHQKIVVPTDSFSLATSYLRANQYYTDVTGQPKHSKSSAGREFGGSEGVHSIQIPRLVLCQWGLAQGGAAVNSWSLWLALVFCHFSPPIFIQFLYYKAEELSASLWCATNTPHTRHITHPLFFLSDAVIRLLFLLGKS